MSSRLSQNIIVGLALALFASGVFWGYIAGTRAAKSAIILHNTDALGTGLQLFYNDQNRYPTTVEFANKDIMLQYFNVFPFAAIPGGSCEQTYSYTNPTQKSYVLGFCLPRTYSGFSAGVNQIGKP